MELRADNLYKSYKKRDVVKDVSIKIEQGEVVGLLGPNGAGKTTTFYMIVGIIRPSKGEVYLGEERIDNIAMYRRARRGIGYLPQEPSVFRKLTVEDNILAALEICGYPRNKRKERIEQLLEEFSITHIRKQLGYMLSGGERRRTEIARTLATNPKFILLDEPFAGIDPLAVEEIMNVIIRLKNQGIGILITDHNVHETLTITDRSYILIEGSIFLGGTAQEISENEGVRKRYLGENFTLERYIKD
ncbi:MAG: LPS export ABC transporter ATP-binding protein [Chlorobiota bacterium]|nr:LPS export ABC transporter ATP-binding protein [Chlorobiota bacterium]QQS67857.1 MAG: LPS export ABC transporter ATP-binding protein [Chlorobiota bacterium]